VTFDDIPEDYRPSYPCPNCEGGNVTESDSHKGCWECDTCGWSHPVS
jgi:ribosomal protein L37AE/L43A